MKFAGNGHDINVVMRVFGASFGKKKNPGKARPKPTTILAWPTSIFVCDPSRFCLGNSCCSHPSTKPNVSVGDFLRISSLKNEPPALIWQRDGDLNLTDVKVRDRRNLIISLSLLHDPCHFLDDMNRCEVYLMRPLTCAMFPFNTFKYHPEELKDYRNTFACLQNVRTSSRQLKFLEGLRRIIIDETKADMAFFWGGKFPVIDVPTTLDEFSLYAREAISISTLKYRRDPNDSLNVERGRRAAHAAAEIGKMLIDGSLYSSGMGSDKYLDILRPILFCIYQDMIRAAFAKLSREALDHYNKITQNWVRLSEEFQDV
ncbi:MAG: YkgJ family cysteine cluster protein [Candidatus Margulisiibacteriota bacterium]